MTQHPFHPNHHASDSLNTLLDALVSGKRVPDSRPASDTDAFADVHLLVSGDSAADASAIPSDDTLDEIWRTVMHAPTSVFAHATSEYVPPQSARQRARLNVVPESPGVSRFQTLLSIGAVAALLLVLISAAWLGRGGNENGPIDSEPGRYAAIPLEAGTPEGSPVAADSWLTPMDPAECTIEPMTSGEYARVIRSEIDISGRNYEIAGPPDPSATESSIATLRQRIACSNLPYDLFDLGRIYALSTDTFLWGSSSPVNWVKVMEGREADPAYQALEDHYSALPWSAYVVISDTVAPNYVQEIWQERQRLSATPDAAYGQGEDVIFGHETPFGVQIYNPNQAVELADGRIAIPATYLYWADDPNLGMLDVMNEDSFVIGLFLMAEQDGQWLVDEEIFICTGQCEPPGTPVASARD